MDNSADGAYLQAVLNTMIDGLLTIDSKGTVRSFNKSAERIFGYQADEVIGNNVKMLMPEPYHSEHDQYLVNYNTTGEKKIIGYGREVSAQRKDGSIFPMELGVNELEVDGTKMFVGTIRDISRQREAEEEIVRSNIELERFAYVASHDLQEPLRMVLNFTKLLEKKYSKNLDETALEYMQFIVRGADRMQHLVDDLLEYSRISQEVDHYVQVDLNETMLAIMDSFADVIQNKGAVVGYDSLPVVLANPMRMMRVIQNLIGNAMKYQAKGVAPEITITAEPRGEFWQIRVADNGIGMRPEYCKKIFEPFKRLHGQNEYPGTGMGLAICRKIIEDLRGEIWAESELGEGSRFYFTVPMVLEEA